VHSGKYGLAVRRQTPGRAWHRVGRLGEAALDVRLQKRTNHKLASAASLKVTQKTLPRLITGPVYTSSQETHRPLYDKHQYAAVVRDSFGWYSRGRARYSHLVNSCRRNYLEDQSLRTCPSKDQHGQAGVRITRRLQKSRTSALRSGRCGGRRVSGGRLR